MRASRTEATRASASSSDAVAASRPHVVIVGAGFAGIEAAKALARAPADITVIDRHNHHCFQPLLYQVATAALSPADVAWPVRRILKHQANATVLLGEVIGIDAENRCVLSRDFALCYDFLVVATGATHSYFGHEEWASAAPGVKRIEDATRIRGKLLLAFEMAEATHDVDQRRRLLTFVVVGGGPTGVEMAGAIAELARSTLPHEFRRIDPRQARIILVEAGPRLLPVLPGSLSLYALRALRETGVEILVDERVVECSPRAVRTDKRQIDAATIIWAAGVRASPAASWLGARQDRAGRVMVEPDLSLPGKPEVFVVGDIAHVATGAGQPVPGLAPSAKQMGRHAGRMILSRLRGAPSGEKFHYRHQGDLATIGRRRAVVSFGRFRLKGFPAWLFWAVAHVYFLIGLRNRLVVAFDWLFQYFTFERGARLITDGDLPAHGDTDAREAAETSGSQANTPSADVSWDSQAHVPIAPGRASA